MPLNSSGARTSRCNMAARSPCLPAILFAWAAATLAALAGSTWSLSLALTSVRVRVCCALVANDWLRSGATVLDLSQRARQSTKGSARRSLVEQTLTTDIVVRATIYEVRTLAIDCGSLTHMFVLCRLMPHKSAQQWQSRLCVASCLVA